MFASLIVERLGALDSSCSASECPLCGRQSLLEPKHQVAGHIDEAFISRVHVIIGFEKLDPHRRKTIWESFLDKLAQEKRSNPSPTVCQKLYHGRGNERDGLEWSRNSQRLSDCYCSG